MLNLLANGQAIGSTLVIKSDQTCDVSVQTTVQSIDAIESLQIIHDGRVVASKDMRNESVTPVVTATLEFEVKAKRSGWIASRALFRAPDGFLRQAHTSPIYLSVNEKPIAVAEDAQYMTRWLEKLADIANANPNFFPDSKAQQSVLSDYAEAHACYTKIVDDACRCWGDK